MTGLALLAASAQAMDMKPFDKAAFQAAQASGKPILVEVTAPWCPVCKVQKPILSDLMKMPSFESFAVFEVDFDSGKDVLRMLNVQKQSTLIAFRGKSEKGRSTGETNAASIEGLLKKAL
jgi:thiol-disulfide isomerase/thioredoxin